MDLEKSAIKFIDDVKKRSRDAGQVATGRTLASLEVKKINDNHIQILANEYIGTLEVGRKAGKVPFNFKQIIVDWSIAKKISFSTATQRNQWAWFVARKIQRQGTRRHKNPQDIFTTPLADLTADIAEKTAIFYQEKIINTIYI